MKQIKGLEILSVKEVVERSTNVLKVNEVCILIFDFINSCCTVAGNLDYFSILISMIKGKESPPIKECWKAWVTLDEINIICPPMKYEVVDYN